MEGLGSIDVNSGSRKGLGKFHVLMVNTGSWNFSWSWYLWEMLNNWTTFELSASLQGLLWGELRRWLVTIFSVLVFSSRMKHLRKRHVHRLQSDNVSQRKFTINPKSPLRSSWSSCWDQPRSLERHGNMQAITQRRLLWWTDSGILPDPQDLHRRQRERQYL